MSVFQSYALSILLVAMVYSFGKYTLITLSLRDFGKSSQYFPDTHAWLVAVRQALRGYATLLFAAISCISIIRYLHHIRWSVDGASHAFTYFFLSTSTLLSLHTTLHVWFAAQLSKRQLLLAQLSIFACHLYLVLLLGYFLQVWAGVLGQGAFNTQAWNNFGFGSVLLIIVVSLTIGLKRFSEIPATCTPPEHIIFQDEVAANADRISASIYGGHGSILDKRLGLFWEFLSKFWRFLCEWIIIGALGTLLLVLGSVSLGFRFEPVLSHVSLGDVVFRILASIGILVVGYVVFASGPLSSLIAKVISTCLAIYDVLANLLARVAGSKEGRRIVRRSGLSVKDQVVPSDTITNGLPGSNAISSTMARCFAWFGYLGVSGSICMSWFLPEQLFTISWLGLLGTVSMLLYWQGVRMLGGLSLVAADVKWLNICELLAFCIVSIILLPNLSESRSVWSANFNRGPTVAASILLSILSAIDFSRLIVFHHRRRRSG